MNRRFRITSTNDFQRVRHSGKTYAHPLVVINICNSNMENSRIGIITAKSLGNAVKRNQARRRIRAVFSEILINFKQQYDIVIIARPAITGASYQKIQEAISKILKKAGLIS